jgi:hypothetical protein
MKLQEVQNRLAEKYPGVGLTFGYIGNCNDRYDDRLWKFFTKVPSPPGADPWCGKPCFSLRLGPTKEILVIEADEQLVALIAEKVEAWLIRTILPRQEHVFRAFNVEVSLSDANYTERLLAEHGASFGARGCGRFNFSLQYRTLEDIKKLLPWAHKVENA